MNKFLLKLFALALFLGALFYYFYKFVPLNMDEFLQYQPIACNDYHLNKKNSFREACFEDGLTILGMKHHLPLRCYRYEGSSQSLLYYPLFKIWESPYSARCFGLIMIFVQAFLIYRLWGFDLIYVFIGLLAFFPYIFVHIVDTGPVSFMTTTVFLICYLAKRWREQLDAGSAKRWRFAIAIGFVMFWGIWTKLVFFDILPGIIVLIAYYLGVFEPTSKSKVPIKHFLKDIGLLVLTAVIPLGILFTGVDIYGKRYYEVLGWGQDITLGHSNQLGQHFNALLKYFTNPLQSAHRVFDVQQTMTPLGVALIVLIISFLTIGIVYLRRKEKPIGFVVLNILLFFTAFLFLVKFNTAWAMHHVVLVFPFLLLAVLGLIAQMKEKKIVGIFLALFFILNACLFYMLPNEKIRPECDPSLNRLNIWLNRNYAHDHVLVVIDWGMYYIKALYGPHDECVLYMDYDPKALPNLDFLKVLRETHRKPVFIGAEGHVNMDKCYRQVKPSFDTGQWRVWY